MENTPSQVPGLTAEPPASGSPGRRSRKRRAKFLAGGAGVVIALMGLVVWAMARPGSTSFYMSTSELLAAGPATGDIRVNGKVVPGSIVTEGLRTTFVLSDGSGEVEVVTEQPLPDAFKERSEVVATGSFDGTTFQASQVLAKCPSKFEAKQEA